jgi:hypothetical protein
MLVMALWDTLAFEMVLFAFRLSIAISRRSMPQSTLWLDFKLINMKDHARRVKRL